MEIEIIALLVWLGVSIFLLIILLSLFFIERDNTKYWRAEFNRMRKDYLELLKSQKQ